MVKKENLIAKYNTLEQKLFFINEKFQEVGIMCEDCEEVISFGYPCNGCYDNDIEKYEKSIKKIEKQMSKIKKIVEKIEQKESYI